MIGADAHPTSHTTPAPDPHSDNHPSIIQWDVFNEGDCVGVFSDVPAVVAWVKAYDPSRLVDTNSGGPANALAVGDVNDIHTCDNLCDTMG